MKSKKPKLMMGGHTDEIYTPKEAVMYLIPFLNKEDLIWDCAFGTGKLKEYFEEEGFKVIGNKDIDFLKDGQHTKEFGMMDLIITNPPYSIKDKFLEKALKLGFPFAFLMPITALGGQKRIKLFHQFGIQLVIPDKRINYITPNHGKSAWFHSVWFCHRMNLPRDLNFVKLPTPVNAKEKVE